MAKKPVYTDEEIKIRADRMRAYLSEKHNIHSEEELDEAFEKLKRDVISKISVPFDFII